MKKLITIALAVVMLFTMVVSVAAEDSPQPKEVYSISVSYSPADGSLGEAGSDKNQVIIDSSGEDGLVTLTAVVKEGKFEKWDIQGEYEIVEGSLTSPKLVIKPLSDIKAVAIFSGSGSSSTPSSESTPSGTSPKTGDPLYLIIGFAVLALAAGAFAIKKIKE